MKLFIFRSIHTQILTSTTLLIIALISAILTVWTTSESNGYSREKINNAQVISKVLSYTYSNEISEDNWSQIRVNLNLLMRENEEIVYVIISDNSKDNKIIVSSPNELQDEYIPNIVPYHVTKKALESTEETTISETYILRDILYGNQLRGKRGEKVIEVSSDILRVSGEKLGKLRIGISLKSVDIAVRNAIYKALVMGFLGLNFGWICSYILAKELSDTVRRLQMSVTKISKGDLQQRVETKHLPDEIRALATAVNDMSSALEISFSKLQKTLESFERFVPDKFVSVIAPLGVENIEVGMASTRKMTILFCDIRGYTSMSEAMAPKEIFLFLNDYLACMGKAIDEAGGFIDKYIGDAIMALFDDEATDSALNAAIAMQKALDKFNHQRAQKGLPRISVGIGIHRGTVVMGTVGFTSRMDSTVIGDAVNVASRIEGLTKQYDCEILVTESVINNLSEPELFSLKLVDKSVKVKGKDQPIAIYELKMGNW
ncbi:MAG: adenylate/guanylate cyclase domain-containing protein [Nostocales cyanobacterium]|nr:MAG: adenylate/guanylate cyclase domain-containing protein [Nostocales cyanobacterium]TAF14269.1 MAG: adenylate/guanylate cyclase domain-containing protein [Nostocales cyanobacterium]